MSTPYPSAKDIERRWWSVDAEGQVLGRLATTIARLLMGKHKAIYTPFLDCGDHVVVVNAEKIALTGNKLDDKKYYRYSGYPGGLKETTARRVLETHPERVLEAAVKGMLPKTRLGRQMYGKLRVYAGPDHPHASQHPEPFVGDKA
ncbi:MAG TPA: 50S ribosomal protein L13 [Acidobacteriota bacterium]|nr:50S ribosomal protein L13 [Acidobacteriota bacterium]